LGINAHSMFKFFSRALSNNELQNWQTETTLTIMIRETFSEYEISLSQVYTITTENCANLLLVIKLLSEERRSSTNKRLYY
jgi:hypothetical protein